MSINLLKLAEKHFEDQYGSSPTIAIASPGRVNLIGEHTDYNDGFVFPMALPLQTILVGRINLNSSSICRVTTLTKDVDLPHSIEFDLLRNNDTLYSSLPKWSNYIIGVIACHPNRSDLPAFDALISSSIPIGGGLSSSAALEAVTCLLINTLVSIKYMPLKSMARLCQKAEHEYAGVPCGIMDQFICLGAQEGTAMLLDCRSLETELIPIEDPLITFLVIDSKVKHNLGSSEYPIRRDQCIKAASLLSIKSLRQITLSELETNKQLLDNICYKRARHVISEIDRCLKSTEALKVKDYSSFGRLMLESHNSLKDDYEVSCQELDQLVDIVSRVEGVFGCRMTGGGFGGCIVALCKTNALEDTIQRVKNEYQGNAEFYACSPSTGARVIYNKE